MNQYKFSIILPVYNGDEYLQQAIDSLFRQTYTNWELIIIDDGSTDQSGKIADQSSKKDRRIRVYHQSNQGLLLARRQGIRRVSGNYLMALDADDQLAETALSKICLSLEQTHADFLFFNFSMDDMFQFPAMNTNFHNLEVFQKEKKNVIYHLIANQVDFNPIWNKVIHRNLFDPTMNYSYFGKRVSMGEDLLQILPLVTAAKKIVFLDENLYFYRINPASMTKQKVDFGAYLSIKEVLLEFFNFVDAW